MKPSLPPSPPPPGPVRAAPRCCPRSILRSALFFSLGLAVGLFSMHWRYQSLIQPNTLFVEYRRQGVTGTENKESVLIATLRDGWGRSHGVVDVTTVSLAILSDAVAPSQAKSVLSEVNKGSIASTSISFSVQRAGTDARPDSITPVQRAGTEARPDSVSNISPIITISPISPISP